MRTTRDLINTLAQGCQVTDRLMDDIIARLERLALLEPKGPLFMPLIAEHYDAFERGDKTEELRRYGKRWNEVNCFPGREIVLSCGFGKKRRLLGRIKAVKKVPAKMLAEHEKAIIACCGSMDMDICVISVAGLRSVSRSLG